MLRVVSDGRDNINRTDSAFFKGDSMVLNGSLAIYVAYIPQLLTLTGAKFAEY